MAVVLEPIRMLTRVFMKHAVGFRRHRRRKEWDKFIPDICNFVTPKYSLLVACQQHISTLLHTAEGRVRLLWGLGGEESSTVFCTATPGLGMANSASTPGDIGMDLPQTSAVARELPLEALRHHRPAPQHARAGGN